MREPKFADAPCFGKEFDITSRICGICLGNKLCQRKSLRALGAAAVTVSKPTMPRTTMRLKSAGQRSRPFGSAKSLA
jgi:hypothetical protein